MMNIIPRVPLYSYSRLCLKGTLSVTLNLRDRNYEWVYAASRSRIWQHASSLRTFLGVSLTWEYNNNNMYIYIYIHREREYIFIYYLLFIYAYHILCIYIYIYPI